MIKVISTISAWMDAWMEVCTALSNKKVSKELLLQRKVIKWWSELLNKKDDFSLSKSQRSLFIKYAKAACCIFWPVFGCCAPQLLVEIVIFCIFYAKKQKRQKSKKKPKEHKKRACLKRRHSTSVLVQTWKKMGFFAKFCTKFVTFLHFFRFLTQIPW